MLLDKRLLYVGAVLLGACHARPDGTERSALSLPPPDPPPVTVHGDTVVQDLPSCPDGDSDGLATARDFCNDYLADIGCHADYAASCGTVDKELFTGVSVIQPPGRRSYNGFGGRGEQMAGAGLCLLADLQNGPVETSLPLALGTSVSQRVGFVNFDPVQRSVRGYRQLRLTVPLFGTFDLRPQTFTAQMVSWDHPFDDQGAHRVHHVGDDIISSGWGLDVVSERYGGTLNMTLARIQIDTPYGPVFVQPQFTASSASPVIFGPYAGTESTRSDWILPGRQPLVADRYGRWWGASTVEAMPYFGGGITGAGWDSQLAVGSRSPADPWDGSGARPDLDLGLPRDLRELNPVIGVSGGLDVRYSPTKLLPDALRSSALGIDFDVFVRPHIDASLADQLDIYVGEAAANGDVRQTNAALQMRTGVGGKASLSFEAGADLHVWVDLGITSVDVVDVHPRAEIPAVSTGDHRDGTSASVSMSSSVAVNRATAWNYDSLNSFHGPVGDGKSWVDSCLAQPPASQSLPVPQNLPPDPLPLAVPYPCNLCLGSFSATVGDVSVPASSKLLFPSTSPVGPSWNCSPATVGCMDMCAFDPVTKALTVTTSQASGPGYCSPLS